MKNKLIRVFRVTMLSIFWILFIFYVGEVYSCWSKKHSNRIYHSKEI